jgi:tetratricopeptide (TPR) repeat protein
LLERQGQTEEAIAEYKAAVQLGSAPEVYVVLARLEEARGMLEEAEAGYRAALESFEAGSPYADSTRAKLAAVLLKRCRPDEALTVLQPFLAEGREASLEVAVVLAAVYEAQGKVEQTDEVYTQLLKEHPDHAGVHYLVAWFAYRQDRLAEATAEMEQATQRAPAFSLAWSSLGYLYDLQDRLADADNAYQTALTAMPANVNALSGLGVLAWRQNKPEEALGYFQEALRKQPEYVKAVPDETQSTLILAHLDLGLAYERLGRTAEASQEFAVMRQLAQNTVAALPTHPQAHFLLGLAHWMIGEMAEAEASLARAVQCDDSIAGQWARLQERIELLRATP